MFGRPPTARVCNSNYSSNIALRSAGPMPAQRGTRENGFALTRHWPALFLVVVLLGAGASWLASHPFGPSFRVMRAWFPDFCNIDGRCRVEAISRNDGAAGDGVVHFQFAQDHFDYRVIPPRLISTQTLSCTRVLARASRDGMVAVGCTFVSGYDTLLPYPASRPWFGSLIDNAGSPLILRCHWPASMR